MGDGQVDWDYVHRSNFESAAFWDINWIGKARNLFEAAKRLEPEVILVWESYRAHAKDATVPLKPDHFHGPYFMLLAFATENLFKAAAVARNGSKYKAAFRRTLKFPQELKKHDLVELAQLVGFTYSSEEEDLLRRLTRSAIWFGRYPAPLDYSEMSGQETFSDGNEFAVSWFGGNDVPRLNAFILSLPARLGLNEPYWDRAA